MAAEQKQILESIRDIISGKEGDEGDILELTQVVNPDGSTSQIKPKPALTEVKTESKPEAKTAGNDVLSEIDALLGEAPKRELGEKEVDLVEFRLKAEKFEIKEEFKPGDAIAPRSENNKENQGNRQMSDDLQTIISGDSANAAKASISELTDNLRKGGREANKVEPSAPFRNGDTVEDVVREMLKPMMKDWLDKNLPKLVNEIVQKEIQKLIPRD